jgi:hypothetical protein
MSDIARSICLSRKGLYKLLLPLLIAATISGCQATGSSYQSTEAKPGSSMIYIYRPNTGPNGKASEKPAVLIDGSSLGILKAQGYLSQEVSGGMHEIRITGFSDKADWSFPEIKRQVNVKPNAQLYYRLMIRFDPNSNNIGSPGMGHLVFLTPVEEVEATHELKNMRSSK